MLSIASHQSVNILENFNQVVLSKYQTKKGQVDLPILQILEAEGKRNLRQIAIFRFSGTLIWLLMAIFAGYVLDQKDWKVQLPAVGIYFFLSIVLLWGPRLIRIPHGIRRWATALFDIPLIFWSMDLSLESNPHPQVAALITVCLFLLFIAPAPSGLSYGPIIVSSVTGFVCSSLLLHDSGVSFPAWTPSLAVIFLLTAVFSIFIARRPIVIAQQYASEQSRRTRLGRYFSPAIARRILENKGSETLTGERKNITILFSDIRSFTSMSEKMEPEDVVHFLNEYLSAMTEQIFNHGGVLDKFMGDGILAYFGAPIEKEDHSQSAIQCAIEMMNTLKKLNENRENKIQIGIGIHTGETIIGDIGPEIRKEFTIIGDPVNLASRLESATKTIGKPILVSEQVMNSARNHFKWEFAGKVKVKGKEEPISLYSPVL